MVVPGMSSLAPLHLATPRSLLDAARGYGRGKHPCAGLGVTSKQQPYWIWLDLAYILDLAGCGHMGSGWIWLPSWIWPDEARILNITGSGLHSGSVWI